MAYFYTDNDYFQKKMNRELSLEGLAKLINDENESNENEDAIHFLIRGEKNQKKLKKQQVGDADLKREDALGQVLRDYNELLKTITRDLKEEKEDGKRFIRTRIKGQVKDDMNYAKDSFLGTFGYHVNDMPSSIPNLDSIDLNNSVHVKSLLPLKMEFDPNNELSFIILDLEEVIQKTLNDEEKLLVEMLRDQFQIKEIAMEMNLTFKQAQYRIKKICQKISNY